MSWLWPRDGDVRGSGKNRQIYYRGEWQSPRGEDTVVRGDQVVIRMVANPDYRKAERASRRRRAR